MNFKPNILPSVVVSEVDKLKETIKELENENVNHRSDLGKLTLERENLKLNLN